MSKFAIYALSVLAVALGILGCVKTRDNVQISQEYGLRDAFKDKFLIGSTVKDVHISGEDSNTVKIIRRHFNTIVAENVMKPEKINPKNGYYNWGPADDFVEFGEQNDMFIVGNCLIWHSHVAPWFFFDRNGNYVNVDTLKQRMHDYVFAVVGRYKGRVHGWDVINDAVLDDGSYRKSPYYEILGEEYIPYALELAHEADPDAQLYINDFGMDNPARRSKYVKIINDLKRRGIRIDAIGMKCHLGLNNPQISELEESIGIFSDLGCKVIITELDMSVLHSGAEGNKERCSETAFVSEESNPYSTGLPREVEELWNARMDSVFGICLRHSDVVLLVSANGVTDSDSWKNDWPIKGRTDYPLLFDRSYRMKPFLQKYINKEKA